MTDSVTLTVRIPREHLERLRDMAKVTGCSKSELASEALADYLAAWEWRQEVIREAVAEADAGAKMIPHEDVVAWIESWGTANELPRPQ